MWFWLAGFLAAQHYATIAWAEPDFVEGRASSGLPMHFVNLIDGQLINAYAFGFDDNQTTQFLTIHGQLMQLDPGPLSSYARELITFQFETNLDTTWPSYISSARIYFAKDELDFTISGDGQVNLPSASNPQDPNANIDYNFMELTWDSTNGLNADISNVDFLGLPLGIEIATQDPTAPQQALGLSSGAVKSVCNSLRTQSQIDGQAWEQECMLSSNGEVIRVLSPNLVLTQSPSAWEGYFDDVADSFLHSLEESPLQVSLELSGTETVCTADLQARSLMCSGDDRSFTTPSAREVFGCTGVFGSQSGETSVHSAVAPVLCAAYNRGTLSAMIELSKDPLSSVCYYPNVTGQERWNYYSMLVHQASWDGLGYAFPYDDVVVGSDRSVAGLLSSPAPVLLTVSVGGYDLR